MRSYPPAPRGLRERDLFNDVVASYPASSCQPQVFAVDVGAKHPGTARQGRCASPLRSARRASGVFDENDHELPRAVHPDGQGHLDVRRARRAGHDDGLGRGRNAPVAARPQPGRERWIDPRGGQDGDVNSGEQGRQKRASFAGNQNDRSGVGQRRFDRRPSGPGCRQLDAGASPSITFTPCAASLSMKPSTRGSPRSEARTVSPLRCSDSISRLAIPPRFVRTTCAPAATTLSTKHSRSLNGSAAGGRSAMVHGADRRAGAGSSSGAASWVQRSRNSWPVGGGKSRASVQEPKGGGSLRIHPSRRGQAESRAPATRKAVRYRAGVAVTQA